ncbi:MAG TPA: hypothetical protein G4O02_17280, partial [Caldilineae bacterium]|nr:hypothetical protein [Caldilineae bacterium]
MKTGTIGQRRALLSLILLGGFLLRLYQLGAQSLWYDETVSAYLASESPARLIAHTSRDIHPPLYYLLLHFWTRLVGDSEFALAFVSVFWGMLLIAITYEIARRLIDPATGLLAAFLVAISPFNVWYSQEVRMYTLGSFLGMITLGALVRLWGERARGWKRAWLVWVVAAAAGLYTLYYFAFLLIAENLFVLAYWLWRRRRAPEMDARWWRWAGAQAAALVLYLPWLPIFYRQATNPPVPPWRSFTGAWAVLRDSWSALVLGQSVEPARAWLPLLIAAAIYLLALWPGREEPRRRLLSNAARGLLASYTFIPIIAIYLLSFITPLFHVRYVFLYAGPFYIVLAWGLRRFGEILGPRERALRAIAVGTLLIGYVAAAGFSLHRFWTDPAYAADDLRGGVQYIAQRMGPDDVVLINAGYVYTAFRYYYRGPVAWQGRLTDYPEEGVPHGQGAVIVLTGTVDGDPNLGWGDPEADFFAMPWPDAEAALRRLFRHHPRVWVLRIYDTVTDPQGRIRAWLEEHGLLFDERLLTGEANARVQGWRTHRAPRLEGPEPSYPVGAFFGDDVLLFQGYDAPEMRTAAGEALWVTLYWQWWAKPGSDEARVDYSVSLGLFDAQGRRWAQADQLLGGPLYPTSRWARGEIIQEPVRLVMPLGVPPGDYFLDVTVYDASSMATLAVSDPIWGVGGNRVRLGPVTVARPNAWPETAWPEFAHRAAAGFDDGIQLVRYDPPPAEARPGNRLGVRLLWRANRSPGQDDQIVLALLDKAGRPVVTNAQPPAGGLYPMSQW